MTGGECAGVPKMPRDDSEQLPGGVPDGSGPLAGQAAGDCSAGGVLLVTPACCGDQQGFAAAISHAIHGPMNNQLLLLLTSTHTAHSSRAS